MTRGASAWFWTASFGLGALTAAVLLGLAAATHATQAAELTAATGPHMSAQLWNAMGVGPGRVLSALAAGTAVTAIAWAGRRLFHADAVGLIAAALYALDPATLAAGHLALPVTVAHASSLLALVILLTPRPAVHWLATPALAVVTILVPGAVWWCVALGVLALLRGHIYAAPRHLATVAVQVLALPAAAAAVAGLASGAWPSLAACVAPGYGAELTLLQAPAYGTVAGVHNPVVWFAGLAAVVILGLAALGLVLARFRIARLPGRLQMRLEQPLPSGYARILWLTALIAAAPPVLWPALVLLALVAGIQQLADDSPGFGLAVAGALIGVSALGVARVWPAITGTNAAAALRLVPWLRLAGC